MTAPTLPAEATVPMTGLVDSTAPGGRTLVTRALPEAAAARTATGNGTHAARSPGDWRLKGIPEPMELAEVLHDGVLRGPPPDSTQAYRVVRDAAGLWQPVGDLPVRLPALAAAAAQRHRADQPQTCRTVGLVALAAQCGPPNLLRGVPA